jgi:iron uptake system component EfeO
MTLRTLRRAGLPVGLAAVALTASCTASTGSADDAGEGASVVKVTSTADECTLSTDTVPSGNVVFKVTNEGNQVTEFYLYDEDGTSVLGEVEDIGPGLSRNLTLQVPPGDYLTACKPGMTGSGIRADFTVTGSGEDKA